ncbi:T9SS-dependent choice-of-anchor J family protein [Aureitalea marina]|uniref:Peptidase S8/S53 domain-containing protein n=1 Tax=Aureitalea marina TaxID=930804 RepID=A0A2S7KMB4_9FLAO|nr:choice-of-anchor J domain-containing protein [Aureitalea marina]PQB03730.1 hypothetical protein BST85_01540 [Aureitalea marina]
MISVSRNSSSSEGPTDDYRIKPDIMGNGTGLYSTYDDNDSDYATISGTSMASPNVAGTLLLLQEHYNDLNASFMRAATLKGLALHTADDVAPAGPDAQSGWGLLNAKFAAETITTAAAASGSAIIDELSLSQGGTYQITVQSNGIDPLQASISWTDPAGTANGGMNSNTPALVNDLDIRLDNGSSFTPWKLTGVTTNGTGDNVVDPYERIDINAASGSYILTVSHKGTLSGGSQNFSLIVTGVVVAATPSIGYASTNKSMTENSNCSFSDAYIPLNIGQAPSEDADVNFSINPGGTATSGLDFDLMTSSVTFDQGATDDKMMTLRIYHDGFVETTETIVIDFTVNANGGDAIADLAKDSFTLTLNNDDTVPTASNSFTLIDEDFETAPAGWMIADRDGDGNNWTIGTVPAGHLSTNQLYSRSWNGVALTPDNYIISSEVTIPAGATSVNLTYQVAPSTLTNSWYQEYYTVYWATDISTYTAIDASPQVRPGGIIAQAVVNENIDMSAYAGQTGHLVFRHHNCTNEEYIAIDNLLLSGSVDTGVQTAVNTGTTDPEVDLPGSGSVYLSDTSTGDRLADVTSSDGFDYGCVGISVDRAGTSVQPYQGSSGIDQVMDKSFLATATKNPSGSVDLTFYFTSAEISGWEAATGQSRNNLVAARNNGTDVETAALSVGSFGSHITLTGSFTSIDGSYFFGLNSAFGPCPDYTRFSGTWSNGMPLTDQKIDISSNYNAVSDLDGCEIVVKNNSTLTISASNYLRVAHNITVESGSTLIVEHQGVVVQTDGTASVVNNGTINVEITTPNLLRDDFMAVGSPMSAETVAGVFGGVRNVQYHTPENFIPNTPGSGVTNFSDDNGNFWRRYNSGSLTAGEGYLIFPQDNPSGTTDLTFSLGTLNNGDVSRPMVFNGDGVNEYGTPNVYANPYASPISADDFLSANGLTDVYFWEHITAPSSIIPGPYARNYSMDDISIYNDISGGLAAANDGGGTTQPNGIISTAQGFGVLATSGGNVTFTNSMRRTTGNTTLRTQDLELDRMWFRVSSDAYEYPLGSNTLIAYSPEATDGLDGGDTNRLDTSVSLYSSISGTNKHLTIQSLEEFNEEDKISMGFSTLVEADLEYTITLTQVQGTQLGDRSIYLIDNLLGRITDLTQESYSFRSGPGDQPGRFTLQFEYEVLATAQNELESIGLYPNPTDGLLNVVSPRAAIHEVVIYDLQGRVVLYQQLEGITQYQLEVDKLESSLYLIELTTVNGKIIQRFTKR